MVKINFGVAYEKLSDFYALDFNFRSKDGTVKVTKSVEEQNRATAERMAKVMTQLEVAKFSEYKEIFEKYMRAREKRRKNREKKTSLERKMERIHQYINAKKQAKEYMFTEKEIIEKEKEYSLTAEPVFDLLYAGNELGRWRLAEYHDFDDKGRGGFAVINVVAVGNGYAFIENFQYLQWKSKEHSTKRKNKFVLGFTEEGRAFLKEISATTPLKNIEKVVFAETPQQAKKLVYEMLTGEKIGEDDIIQGDVVLKKMKKLPKETREKMKEISAVTIDRSHLLQGKLIRKYREYIEVEDAYLMHLRNQHDVKYVPAGYYKILTQKDYALWNFSRRSID